MFRFRQFTVNDDKVAMKVGTDGVLLGAWAAGGAKILDIGTGSGVIAMMMAQRYPDSTILAIDIDKDAVAQTQENVGNSPFSNMIDVKHISLQDYAQSNCNETFDAIVCNPPFFHNSLKSPDGKRNMARHSDSLSGSELMKCSHKLLSSKGTLSIITPANDLEAYDDEAGFLGMGIRRRTYIKTTEKKQPKRVLTEYSNDYSPIIEELTECLTTSDGIHTDWYKNLMGGFIKDKN